MPGAIEPPLATVDLPDGVRYVLSPRANGIVRTTGRVMMLAGLVIVTVAAALAAKQIHDGRSWFAAMLRVQFAGAGLLMGAGGVALVRSRCVVELRGGRLWLIEPVGPFTRRWSRPIDDLLSLQVQRSGLKVNGRPVQSGWWSDLSAIRAHFEGGHILALAVMYPFATAMALAETIARQIDVMLPDRIVGDKRPLVEVVDEHVFDDDRVAAPPPTDEPLQWPDPPAASKVLYERTADGVSLRIPPVGYFGAPMVRASVIFTIVWCIFIGAFTIFAIVAAIGSRGQAWFFPLFTLPFWAAGIGMAIYDMHLAKREAIIEVIGDTLLVTHKGLRSVRQNEWSREQVQAIRCGASGTSVNDRQLMQLQIQPHQGKTVNLLTGRDDDELRWMAQVLRLALRHSTK